MKIRTQSRRTIQASPRKSEKASPIRDHLAGVAKLTALLLFAALLCNGYVFLNQKIAESNRALVKVRREAVDVDREIEQLRLRIEELSSWHHIGPMCDRFQLGLQLPSPEQVSSFRVLPPVHAKRLAEYLERPARTAAR